MVIVFLKLTKIQKTNIKKPESGGSTLALKLKAAVTGSPNRMYQWTPKIPLKTTCIN